MRQPLQDNLQELAALLPRLADLHPQMLRLGQAMLDCWKQRGKILTCGNGGSCADAMHLAEELTVRFEKDRRALAAIALADPTAITCCGNDYGFDRVFSRQVEALGNAGDVLIVFSTSGNSPSILRAVEVAKAQRLTIAAFLGKGGGKLKDLSDIELLTPSSTTARIQECHQLLYHTLCQWIDAHID